MSRLLDSFIRLTLIDQIQKKLGAIHCDCCYIEKTYYTFHPTNVTSTMEKITMTPYTGKETFSFSPELFADGTRFMQHIAEKTIPSLVQRFVITLEYLMTLNPQKKWLFHVQTIATHVTMNHFTISATVFISDT